MAVASRLEVLPVPGLPEVCDGDDLAALVAAALTGPDSPGLRPGDVLVVSSKLVSKSAGLRDHRPERESVVADQSVRVVAERAVVAEDGTVRATRIVEAVAGPVMAAAGVDASNTGPAGGHLLLPADPDAAAQELLGALLTAIGAPADAPIGVVLSDTAGRPWRGGVTDFALGAAGVTMIDDLRGGVDVDGRALHVTLRGVGDEIAAAADLVKGKATGIGAVVVRGSDLAVGVAGDHHDRPRPGAADLVRTGPSDWFRTGDREAVRAALGIPPGSAASAAVGLAPTAPEPVSATVVRAVRAALHTLADEIGDLADTVGVDLDDTEVLVGSTDPYVLGLAAARVCIALRGERLAAQAPERRSATQVRIALT